MKDEESILNESSVFQKTDNFNNSLQDLSKMNLIYRDFSNDSLLLRQDIEKAEHFYMDTAV